MTTTLRLVRHLVWYDLRASRALSLIWLGVVALDVALLVVGPLELTERHRRPPFDELLAAGRMLGAAFLAATIVQRDSLVDAAAFWRTRPIPRLMLWASKTTAIAVVTVIVPALVLGLSVAVAGVAPGDATRAALDIAVDHAGVAAPVMLLAALTPALVHAVAAALGLGVALVLAGMLFDLVGLRTGLWPLAPPPSVAAALMIGGAGAITLLHYATLRHRLIVPVAAAFTLLLFTMAMTGTPLPPPSYAPAPASLVAPGSVEVTLEPGDEPWLVTGSAFDRSHEYAAHLEVRSADPSLLFAPRSARAVVSLSGTSPVVVASVDGYRGDARREATADDAPFATISALAGLRSLAPYPGTKVFPHQFSLRVQPADFAALQVGGTAWTEVIFDVLRLRRALTQRLEVGATVVMRGGRVRIEGAAVGGGKVAVDLHWLGRRPPYDATSVLHDAGRTWAVAGSSTRDERSAAGWWLDVKSAREQVTFVLPPEIRVGSDAQALRALTLELFEAVDTGHTYAASLDVPGLRPATTP